MNNSIIKKLYLISVFSPLSVVSACIAFVLIGEIVGYMAGGTPKFHDNVLVTGFYIFCGFCILLPFAFCIFISPYIIAGYICSLVKNPGLVNRFVAGYLRIVFLIFFSLSLILPMVLNLSDESYRLSDHQYALGLARKIMVLSNLAGVCLAIAVYVQYKKIPHFKSSTTVFHAIIFLVLYPPLYLINFILLSEFIYARSMKSYY